MKYLNKLWPWSRIADLEKQLTEAHASADFARQAHKVAVAQLSTIQSEHKSLVDEHAASTSGLRKMADILSRRGLDKLVALLILFLCYHVTAQPLLRNPLTTNNVSLAPANGWIFGWSNGVPVWTLNGGALTNVHDGIWTNNANLEYVWFSGQPEPDDAGSLPGPGWFFTVKGELLQGTNVIHDVALGGDVFIPWYHTSMVSSNEQKNSVWGDEIIPDESYTWFTGASGMGFGSPDNAEYQFTVDSQTTNGVRHTFLTQADPGGGQTYLRLRTNNVDVFKFDKDGTATANNFTIPINNGGFSGLVVSGSETNAAGSRVAYLADINAGTVTSVDITQPGGFGKSGAPIIGSGTINISATSGGADGWGLRQSNSASLWSQNAASDTNLNASELRSGTVPNARLSAIPNSALANSSVTYSGTANQITGGGTVSLGGSATAFAIANPLITPGPVAATQITNASFAAVGVVTNDASGKEYTTPTLPNALLANSSLTVAGTANQINVSGGGPVSLGGTATLSLPNPTLFPGTVAVTGETNTSQLLLDPAMATGTFGVSLDLTNTTVATAGNQAYSPFLRFGGNGWKTTATAASQPVIFTVGVIPVQGSANPTGNLVISNIINGATPVLSMLLDQNGLLTAPGGLKAQAGVSLGRVEFDINVGTGSGSVQWLYGNGTRPAYMGNDTQGAAVFSLQLNAVDFSVNGGSIRNSGTVIATNGFYSLKSTAAAPTAITFPATTVNWTNANAFNIAMYIDNGGVTGTAVKKNGTQVFSSLTGDCTLMMKPGDFFSETYTLGTPVGNWEPQ